MARRNQTRRSVGEKSEEATPELEDGHDVFFCLTREASISSLTHSSILENVHAFKVKERESAWEEGKNTHAFYHIYSHNQGHTRAV